MSQARKAILVRAAQDTREATEEAQVDLEKYVDDLKDKVLLIVPPPPPGLLPGPPSWLLAGLLKLSFWSR